ncbi:MAG: FAD-binding protein [Acidimicrobiia bacterium]|nr:FAD-binding protein [Acidimicrobiia bacterium]
MAPHESDKSLVSALQAALPPGSVHHDPLELALYGRDASLERGEVAAVCFPTTAAEVQACVRVAVAHGRAFVPRGAGTGLAGGAVPQGRPVMVVTTRMDRVLEVDVEERVAWVQPGVINLDLSRQLRPLGYHFAPDPSSQQSCSIGGNVANNSGGPHCLAYGVTSAHVLAVEVVLASGDVAELGGLDADPAGLDLRGLLVGSEGTLGIVTKVAVRITENPPDVRTLLADFVSPAEAAAAVTAIIASGVVPAAIEMMDQRITEAVEAYVHAGYPTDAGAVLLVEVDGLAGGVATEAELVSSVCRDHGARTVRVAVDEAERMLLWKGRKTAFGAIARIKPNYYLHDTVVPRTRLLEVISQVYEIAEREDLIIMNVFHAGDGNLHPLIVFDAREPGVLERVHRAGEAIVKASLAAGGVLSGEHGVGLEKRPFMRWQFTDADLDAQARVREAFDPDGVSNPGKVLPEGSRCGDIQALSAGAREKLLEEGAWV